MAFNKIISDGRFWKMVVLQGLAFAVIYQVIMMLLEYGGFDFSSYYEDKLANGGWVSFLFGLILGAFIYGFIISYGQFRSKIRKENREN